MSDATNKIKKIIQALLAKATGTTNEAEAELFLAKANELLQRHQLDVSDLVDADDPIVHHVGLSQAESGHAWRWRLYSAVARLYGCKTIHCDVGLRDNGRGRKVPFYEQRLVGRESAVITTDLMYPWIVGQVRQKAREIVAQIKLMYDEEDIKDNDLCTSEQGQAKRVAAALISRINRLIALEQANPSVAMTETARNALVVISNAVTARYEELYPDTVTLKSRPKTDHLSRKAAESIGLHRQAGGKTQLKLGHG